jgi:hypothetical protein
MKDYSDDNPPKKGNGRKIYNALKRNGFNVSDLHYNANCWGQAPENGWGTWACAIQGRGLSGEFFCGVSDGAVYIQRLTAPYTSFILD